MGTIATQIERKAIDIKYGFQEKFDPWCEGYQRVFLRRTRLDRVVEASEALNQRHRKWLRRLEVKTNTKLFLKSGLDIEEAYSGRIGCCCGCLGNYYSSDGSVWDHRKDEHTQNEKRARSNIERITKIVLGGLNDPESTDYINVTPTFASVDYNNRTYIIKTSDHNK